MSENTLSEMLEHISMHGGAPIELDPRNVYRVTVPKGNTVNWGQFMLVIHVDGEEVAAVVQPLALRAGGRPYLDVDVHAYQGDAQSGAELTGMTEGRQFVMAEPTGLTGIHGRPAVNLASVLIGPPKE